MNPISATKQEMVDTERFSTQGGLHRVLLRFSMILLLIKLFSHMNTQCLRKLSEISVDITAFPAVCCPKYISDKLSICSFYLKHNLVFVPHSW